MAGIKQWWGGQSKTAKTLYIVGTLATIGTIIYFATRKKDGKKKTSSDDKTNQDIPDNTTEEKEKNDGGNKDSVKKDDSVNTKTETTPSSQSDLPNSGVGCGSVITNFDRDFDYVKCNNIWYTKSKPNAASPYARGLYKVWKSLEGNKVASERLNRKYPK